MAKDNKKETPVALNENNIIDQVKAGQIMTAEQKAKMDQEIKEENDKQVIRETKRRHMKIAYVRAMSLIQKRKSAANDKVSTYNIRQLGRLERFLLGFTVTDIIVNEYARTPDDILELETLDEKKKTLTILMPATDGGKREAKEFKIGDEVPPVISYIEFDKGTEKLNKNLKDKKDKIEDEHKEEVELIKRAAGEYWSYDWTYNLKIVTEDGLKDVRY